MPAHRSRTTHRRSSTRRRTSWARTNATVAIPAVNQQTTIDLLASWKTAGGAQQACTVGRTHLRILPIGAAPLVGNSLFVGLLKGQFNDIGTNIAGAPNPSADFNEDWALWDVLGVDPIGAFWPGGGLNASYDLRSMRKLEELQETFNLSLSSNGWGAFPLNVRVVASVLLLLP